MMNDEFVTGSVRLDIIILIEGSTLDSCYDIYIYIYVTSLKIVRGPFIELQWSLGLALNVLSP